MIDCAQLLRSSGRLADWYRSLPASRLRLHAADGLALARALADAAGRIEDPASPPRQLPPAGPFAVGDQIAVASHDLAAALADLDEGTKVITAGGPMTAAGVLDWALREVSAHQEATTRSART